MYIFLHTLYCAPAFIVLVAISSPTTRAATMDIRYLTDAFCLPIPFVSGGPKSG